MSPRAIPTTGGQTERRAHTGRPAQAAVTNQASLSLDLDNLWSYLRTHGDAGWESFPTYLPTVVPRILDLLDELNLRITFFVVGQDAARPENSDAITSLSRRGHEIANHSFRHEPWLHRYTLDELDEELTRAEDAIRAVTGIQTTGFRGPGYSLSPDVIRVLSKRGYRYDASTLPTVVGPLARAFYFRSAHLSAEERTERAYLFGTWRDGLRPLRPYQWEIDGQSIKELPVTTLPLFRVPIHVSYLLYLGGISPGLAQTYFSSALRLCRLRRIEPSILLHPLDFMGTDDLDQLRFFPGMGMAGSVKRQQVRRYLRVLSGHYQVVPVGIHVESIAARGGFARAKSGESAAPGGRHG